MQSPPPRRPATRRKTLAGVDITRSGKVGFSLRRSSDRVRARRKAAPIAKEAETFVCRGLGIINDGQIVTAAALNEFADMFKDQVEPSVNTKLRILFKLDSATDTAVDDAMINHGGAQALDAEVDLTNVSDV